MFSLFLLADIPRLIGVRLLQGTLLYIMNCRVLLLQVIIIEVEVISDLYPILLLCRLHFQLSKQN
jgi:hypothetical protein